MAPNLRSRKKNKIQAQASDLPALAPSAPRLPQEVLGQIFLQCLPERHADRLNPYEAPMLVCQVSSDWRAAAIAEQGIWDTVILPTSTNHMRYYRFIQQGGVQRWFDRTSPARPLIFGEELVERPTSSLIDDYLGIVLRYARRFKHLSLVMTRPMHLETLRIGFPKEAFDRLESVSLCYTKEMTTKTLQSYKTFITPFLTVANLRHVTLSLQRADPTKLVLPWTQLTSMDVVNKKKPLDLGEWRRLLEICPMQRGTFIFPRETLDDVKPTLRHSSMRSLTLISPPNWEQTSTLSDTFACVAFPSLQHLRFQFEEGRKGRGDHLQELGRTCSKFKRTLQTLAFVRCGEIDKEDTLVEASGFIEHLNRNPGVFTSLRNVVLPAESVKMRQLLGALGSHPQLSVTITVTPKRVQTWMRSIALYETSIKNRMHIVSTNDCPLLEESV